ncbi:Uncharacterised protein [Mycobacteroides abscessus subsp. abscessus]|nr:Uncharacterised protein [Mycobacteroides abscessus subsp. abscessus]
MVGEEIDLVDVEHSPVGTGKQPGREHRLAVAQYGRQIQRPDDAVLGGADREFDDSARGRLVAAVCRVLVSDQWSESADDGRFGRALLAADQHTADARRHRAQDQRQLQPLLPHHGAERIPRRSGAHRSRDSVPTAHERVLLAGRIIETCGMPSSRYSSLSTTKPNFAYMSMR